jgi:hypothetical protein
VLPNRGGILTLSKSDGIVLPSGWKLWDSDRTVQMRIGVGRRNSITKTRGGKDSTAKRLKSRMDSQFRAFHFKA